jgi:hypothetical protein
VRIVFWSLSFLSSYVAYSSKVQTMGRATRVKQERKAARRPRSELIAFVETQLDNLRRSATAFDEGHEAEAARLALTLRVMLHDASSSHSLLGQLGIKEKLHLYDTAPPITPRIVMSNPGLVVIRVESSVGATYRAPLEDIPPDLMGARTYFAPWWRNPVLKMFDQTWSREWFVKVLANKEGGAHVDPHQDELYEALAKQNRLGWSYSGGQGQGPVRGNIVAISVRQIAHEFLMTCDQQLTTLLG